jgi:hypothetical protein
MTPTMENIQEWHKHKKTPSQRPAVVISVAYLEAVEGSV